MRGSVRDSRIDFDGLLTGSNNNGLKEPQRAYVMVLRSGVLEAVCSSLARGTDGRFLILPKIEATIVESARRYIHALNLCGIQPPFVLCVSLLDVEGRELLHGPMVNNAFPEDLPSATLTRDRLSFGECVFDSVPAHDAQSAILLRPILDHLANSAGLPSAVSFNAVGDYEPVAP
jgi:hypothetical protein